MRNILKTGTYLAFSLTLLASAPQLASATEPTSTAASASDSLAPESTFLEKSDEKWRKLITDGQELLNQDKPGPAMNTFKRALLQIEKSGIEDPAVKQRMTAISSKKYAQALVLKSDFIKADQAIKDAVGTYEKLGLNDEELAQVAAEIAKHYRTIEAVELGDVVKGYLSEAGVNKISVFRKDDCDLVEINLNEKYVKPVESKEVPKISFNKKVSFEFFNKPNGDYQVSKIQGLQVFAKSLWVNLMESLLKTGDKPVAEVTAGKMGVTKTVTVDIPSEVYNSTKEILDKLVSAIKGAPAYAATPRPAAANTTPDTANPQSTPEPTQPVNQSSGTTSSNTPLEIGNSSSIQPQNSNDTVSPETPAPSPEPQ
ncbi:MAG: hypothetical protein K2X93_05910 [Candidatus Obscuribacterales bacterium]|nr:hypothetical protein [Candidatus Obscuribacterales bacterium]